MKNRTRLLFVLLVTFLLLTGWGATAVSPVHAQSNCDPDDVQESGAVYRICVPEQWNGDLVVYAHGYVAFNEPIAIPEDQLSVPGGPSIPEIINDLGYAFATTSYSVNGLAVKQGIADLLDLVQIFSDSYGDPNRVYLVGPSEGGLITALGIEQHSDVFDGGLSTCGPVGDFRKQINYWGDVRVLFDYFFPGVLPGSPIDIPSMVVANWETIYEPQARAALEADPDARTQLLITARIPHDPADPEMSIDSILGLLWYNVFATNDGIEKLGGQPYDNSRRIYLGSDNDLQLNRSVPRFQADATAVAEINAHYQTAGNLQVPVVTMHTVGDHIVPYWHEPLYRQKIIANGDAALHTNIPSLSYGHCTFDETEVLVAFALMVYQVTGEISLPVDQVLSTPQAQTEYQNLAQKYDLPY